MKGVQFYAEKSQFKEEEINSKILQDDLQP